jgi:hypothetical protein
VKSALRRGVLPAGVGRAEKRWLEAEGGSGKFAMVTCSDERHYLGRWAWWSDAAHVEVAAAIDDICPMSQWRCASLPHGLFACATFRAPRRTHSPERQPRQQMLKGRVVPLYLLFMRVQYRDGRISIILDKADDLPVEPKLTPYARWSTKTSAGRIIPSPLFC